MHPTCMLPVARQQCSFLLVLLLRTDRLVFTVHVTALLHTNVALFTMQI